jgi:hypothetical protein
MILLPPSVTVATSEVSAFGVMVAPSVIATTRKIRLLAWKKRRDIT